MKSKNIFGGLVFVMILIKLFDILFDPNKVFPGRVAIFSWEEIVVVLVLGTIGLITYKKIELPDFDNENIRRRKIVLRSVGAGILFSLLLVIFDSIARIGDMSVGFPLSALFYVWGAISSEVIFRLFAISLFVFLFSNVIFKGKYKRRIYWISTAILSLLASSSMLMAFSNPEIGLNKPEEGMMFILGTIVFSSEMTAFGLLKRYGFLSNLLFRLSFYLVWHMIWPAFFY